jgi:hypothetical protein
MRIAAVIYPLPIILANHYYSTRKGQLDAFPFIPATSMSQPTPHHQQEPKALPESLVHRMYILSFFTFIILFVCSIV